MGISIEFLERRYSQNRAVRLQALALYKKKIVRALRPFMPSKVYIFGSLVKETWGSDSDIDIAIEGVAIDKAAQIDRALKNAFGHVDFDIVFVEYAEKSLLESILYEGEVVYEK